jgi:hypothetical protein
MPRNVTIGKSRSFSTDPAAASASARPTERQVPAPAQVNIQPDHVRIRVLDRSNLRRTPPPTIPATTATGPPDMKAYTRTGTPAMSVSKGSNGAPVSTPKATVPKGTPTKTHTPMLTRKIRCRMPFRVLTDSGSRLPNTRISCRARVQSSRRGLCQLHPVVGRPLLLALSLFARASDSAPPTLAGRARRASKWNT